VANIGVAQPFDMQDDHNLPKEAAFRGSGGFSSKLRIEAESKYDAKLRITGGSQSW
jgi:hypothetical protein